MFCINKILNVNFTEKNDYKTLHEIQIRSSRDLTNCVEYLYFYTFSFASYWSSRSRPKLLPPTSRLLELLSIV